MIDNKDAEIERLHGRVTENILFIVRRDAIIREKDDRIAELEAEIKEMNDIYTLESILNSDRSEP